MSYTWSLVAITTATLRPTAEALGLAMGHSGNEFNFAIGDPATHYALHAWVTPETAQVWLGNAYPVGTGYTNDQIDAVRSQLIISCIDGADPLAHFESVMAANNLSLGA